MNFKMNLIHLQYMDYGDVHLDFLFKGLFIRLGGNFYDC